MDKNEMYTKKDIKYLQEYKKKVAKNLASQLNITVEVADKVLKLLETEDLLRIEAPEPEERSATVLITDKRLMKNELGITSHKVGNIILNAYLDWKELAFVVLSSIGTGAAMENEHPFLTVVNIMSAVLSASALTDIKISENGTAIILALQKHKKHKVYTATEKLCKKEANEILTLYGYDEMDDRTFQNEITRLIKYRCIEKNNSMIHLREKVISHY
ncbi:hypothetical protein [Eubacterium sp. An11]|uniref:hypothetical protein n=1 Tax=Eubacterium sp. An11 TaxID=1965542 RepID=UPI001120B001|nr:hypothetical protein [Eubacterium sp. An11]